jgi:transposase
MLMLPSAVKIYLASQPTDMRRGIDGLLGLVRSTLAADPYGGHMFVFIGRARDRVKVLFFEQGGFVVYYKRLERGRFQVRFPAPDATHVELETTELAMLLRGIDFFRVKQPTLWRPAQRSAA